MKQEDREALRLFYQTLAKSNFTVAQVALYNALKGSKEDRLAWIKQYAPTLAIPSNITIILSSMDAMTKADLAILAASYIAPKLEEKSQGFFSTLTYYLNPFNWF